MSRKGKHYYISYYKRVKKWQLHININGCRFFIGNFDTEEEAKEKAEHYVDEENL